MSNNKFTNDGTFYALYSVNEKPRYTIIEIEPLYLQNTIKYEIREICKTLPNNGYGINIVISYITEEEQLDLFDEKLMQNNYIVLHKK